MSWSKTAQMVLSQWNPRLNAAKCNISSGSRLFFKTKTIFREKNMLLLKFGNNNIWPLNLYYEHTKPYCIKPEGRIHQCINCKLLSRNFFFYYLENVVCFLHLLHIFKCTSDKIFSWMQTIWTLIRLFSRCKQYESWSDCSLGSSLIWVHTVCNIVYLRTRLAPVLKTIFHQCVISYTCSQSYSDGPVLKQSHQS